MNVTEESLFAEALEKPTPQERAAFLDRACADSPGLRQSVEALLSAYAAGQFLEAGAPGLAGSLEPLSVALVEGPGTEIGPYKLLEQIGEGGMGLVFLAEQAQPIRRRLALKIIKPGMDSKQVIARFEAERQALALMDHPHIARVFDAGTTTSGRPYFVMELVRGIPITDYCDQHKLTIRKRLDLFVQVCQAVQHAHQKGIIHRDLKPSNVLVAHDDTAPLPKIIDFGIAKATSQQLTERTLFTALTQLVGTPRYMSPEQAALNHLDVDTRSDVYSLGVLLYELLTGTTPFDEDQLKQAGLDEVRRIIQEVEPPRPSMRVSTLGAALTTMSVRRGVDPRRISITLRGDLDWIVMKTLEKDRRRRYESASALAADLGHYLNSEAVDARPPSRGYRLRKYARRNKVALATSGLVAAALLIGTAISVWQAIEAMNARQLADDRLESEKTALAGAQAAAERERQMADQTRQKQQQTATLLAGHQLDEGLKRLNEGNSEGLLDLLDARETADDLPKLREAIGQLWAIGHSRWEGRLAHVLPTGLEVAFSPDGRTLAILGGNAVHLIDIETGQSRFGRLPVPEQTMVIVFSPDSQLFATHSVMNGCQLWRTATGKPLGQTLQHNRQNNATMIGCRSVAFSPDSKLLATAGADGTVWLWNTANGRAHAGPLAHGGEVNEVAFSPNGSWLASAGISGIGRLWDVATGQVHGPELKAGGSLHHILFTPDSQRVITLSVSNVKVWESETGSLLKQLISGWSAGSALSPDGKTLAIGMVDWHVHFRDIETGQAVGQTLHQGGRINSIKFSPDGKRLAVLSNHSTTIIDDIDGPAPMSAVLVGTDGKMLAWSPDGGLLAASGRVELWRVEDRPLRTIPVRFPGRVALSPDGKTRARSMLKGRDVLLEDVATGVQLALLKTPGVVTCLAFSQDSTRLAFGTWDWEFQIWDIDEKQAKKILVRSSPDRAYGLAWSKDGTRIMAATPLTGLVTEFNTGTGQAIGPPYRHGDWVRAVSYSPDESMIATVGGDDTASVVRLWSTCLGPNHLPLVLPAKLPGGNYEIPAAVIFSHDGRLLCVRTGQDDAVLFRLPPAPADLREYRLRTYVALGVRRDASGQVRSIFAEEWSRLREELAALDRQREPIRWDALEAAFAEELMELSKKMSGKH